MSKHGTFGVSSCTWSVAEHIYRIGLWLFKYYLRIFATDFNDILEVPCLDSYFWETLLSIFINRIEAHKILQTWNFSILSKPSQCFERFLLNEYCAHFGLIEDIGNSIRSKTLKARNYGYGISHASKVWNSPFFSIFGDNSQESVLSTINILYWRESKLINTYNIK